MSATPVRWFHSGMANAPVLSGTAGALIAVLDACLLDGFDPRAVNDITVAGGVATATISAGHAFDVHAVIRIAGVTGALAALNDDWRIKTVPGGSTFTFDCPGIPDGSAAGTITAKRAPAGWTKPFSGTNKAVYQSAALDSTQLYLRVNDADPRYTRVRGYEQMTDVDTGSGLFPTIAQLSETYWTWTKSNAADTSAREWILIADDRFIHFLPRFVTGQYPSPNMFGDLVTTLSSDAYHCLITAHGTPSPSLCGAQHIGAALTKAYYGGYSYRYLARAGTQAEGAISATAFSLTSSAHWNGKDCPPAPGLDGEIYIGSEIYINDGSGSSNSIRGTIPGLRSALQASASEHLATHKTPTGDVYLAVDVATGMDLTAAGGRAFFDIIGPWR